MPPDRDPGPALAAFADAAALGLPALASMLADAQHGIIIFDGERRYVYANPAACQLLGRSLEQLRDRDFLASFPVREHDTMLARFAEQPGGRPAPFRCVLLAADGAERDTVCSVFAIDMAGQPHSVAVFWDLTGTRVAARTASALAQAAAQLVGTGTTSGILTGIARHAVEGTRALSCGISVVGEDRKLASAGAYSPEGPGYGVANPAWIALADVPVDDVIEAMTAGSVVFAEAPGQPAVVPDARLLWEANPLTRAFAANLGDLDWQAGVYVPLSWEKRVIGFLAVFLPAGLAGPSEAELAFYTALANQAAVAVMNARLAAQAAEAAALLERDRLARELHDSVSQGLFAMTMHARAAQLSMDNSGVDSHGPLGHAVHQLAELTAGALAEMRALIFELRPGALAEEGHGSAGGGYRR